jgi:uncharacterized membrane protein SirB2
VPHEVGVVSVVRGALQCTNCAYCQNCLFQRSVDINPTLHNATDILLAPILLMTMCARGFVLWLMNVGMVIYLGMAASKLNKKVHRNNCTKRQTNGVVKPKQA